MIYYDGLARKLDRLPKQPDNHELYNDIGVMLYELNDYVNARKYFAKALELSPSTPDILYNYAHALYSCFEWSKAVEIFKEYIKLQPKDKAAMEKIADACYQLGDYCSAVRYQNLLSFMEDGI